MIRAVLIAALIALANPAHAYTIRADNGGVITDYLMRFALIAKSKEPVRIVGECHSACTLVLGIVPWGRLCASPKARFGFHRASAIDAAGRFHDSAEGTDVLMATYPPSVLAWLARWGGLSRQLKYASGAALGLPRCK